MIASRATGFCEASSARLGGALLRACVALAVATGGGAAGAATDAERLAGFREVLTATEAQVAQEHGIFQASYTGEAARRKIVEGYARYDSHPGRSLAGLARDFSGTYTRVEQALLVKAQARIRELQDQVAGGKAPTETEYGLLKASRAGWRTGVAPCRASVSMTGTAPLWWRALRTLMMGA